MTTTSDRTARTLWRGANRGITGTHEWVSRRLSRFWIGCATAMTVLAVTIAASGAVSASAATHQSQDRGMHWVASWGASPSPATPAGLVPGDISAAGFSNQTVRDIVFTSVGGSAARVTISNTVGAAPLRVGLVDVAVAGPRRRCC